MDAAKLTEELVERFNVSNSAPFLFVGSGLSRRYLSIDDWTGLLKQLAALTPQPYPYFFSKADQSLPRVATLIAESFYEIWWSDTQYRAERAVHAEHCTNVAYPLKLQVAKYIRECSDLNRVPEALKQELDLLRKARVSGIITTNWDSLLELLYPDFTVFVGQNQSLFSQTFSIAEIFKIHGSCHEADSLVLTDGDYEAFNERNAYLAAKMLTTFLDHPIVFLGYSLADDNIKSILKTILTCLDEPRIEFLSKRLIFVQYEGEREEPTVTDTTVNLGTRDLRLTTVRAKDFTPIYQALASTEHRLNPKLLRQIKEHLYELVKTNDPSEKISVIDIEELDQRQDIEVVVGIGISGRISEKGLISVQTKDLLHDIVFDGTDYNGIAAQLVSQTLDGMLRGNRKHVPLFKYLKLAGLLDDNGRPIRSKVPTRVMERALFGRSEFEDSSYRYKRDELIKGGPLDDLVQRHGPRKAVPYLTYIEHEPNQLQRFLQENFAALVEQNGFRKLICIYDRCRFGPGFPVYPSDVQA